MKMKESTKKLEVLVVEDDIMHQKAAKEQLAEYSLTLAGSFDEAIDMIKTSKEYDRIISELKEVESQKSDLEEGSEAYIQLDQKLGELRAQGRREFESPSPNKYAAILTDLMLPQGRGDCQSDKSKKSELQPFGYTLALIAGKYGIPNIGVITDANHHKSAMAYAMDFLEPYFEGKPIKIGEGKAVFANQGSSLNEKGQKNWKIVLDSLFEEK